MHHPVATAIVLAELVNLGVAVVTASDAIIGFGILNLIIFLAAKFQARLFVSGLQETTATAIIVGAVRGHLDKVFLAHNGFNHESQVFGDRISVAFVHDLAGILDGEFDFQVSVPIRIDLQFALADPFRIIFIDVFNLEFVVDIEFFQSFQD